jgi:hypothetical protein
MVASPNHSGSMRPLIGQPLDMVSGRSITEDEKDGKVINLQ